MTSGQWDAPKRYPASLLNAIEAIYDVRISDAGGKRPTGAHLATVRCLALGETGLEATPQRPAPRSQTV